MPKQQRDSLHRLLEEKIDSTTTIINTKVNSFMKEIRGLFIIIGREIAEVKEDGKETKALGQKTNGRVTMSETKILQLQDEWNRGFDAIREINANFDKVKTEKEFKTEKYITELENLLKKEKEKEEKLKEVEVERKDKFRNRIIIGIILAVIFIASSLELINAEFIKSFI